MERQEQRRIFLLFTLLSWNDATALHCDLQFVFFLLLPTLAYLGLKCEIEEWGPHCLIWMVDNDGGISERFMSWSMTVPFPNECTPLFQTAKYLSRIHSLLVSGLIWIATASICIRLFNVNSFVGPARLQRYAASRLHNQRGSHDWRKDTLMMVLIVKQIGSALHRSIFFLPSALPFKTAAPIIPPTTTNQRHRWRAVPPWQPSRLPFYHFVVVWSLAAAPWPHTVPSASSLIIRHIKMRKRPFHRSNDAHPLFSVWIFISPPFQSRWAAWRWQNVQKKTKTRFADNAKQHGCSHFPLLQCPERKKGERERREIQISQNTDSILFGPSLHMDFTRSC